MADNRKKEAVQAAPNFWKESLERFLHNPVAVISCVVLIIIIIACVSAPLLTPYTYSEMNIDERYAPFSKEHIFGTDGLGRDLFARVLYGGQVTLNITFTALLTAAAAGTVLGIATGVFGGTFDNIVLRIMDGLSAIPTLFLAVMVESALGFGVGNYKYAIALSLIPPFVRLLRPMVISILSSEYVEAARALGVGKIEIIARHVIPNITAPVLIHFSNTAAEALLTCTILSYVGIGVNPPMPEWGELVAYGYNYIRSQSNVSLIPCFVVAITALAMNLLGNGLRDALDPDAGDR